MPIQQDLDLIIYNLEDGYQYQLLSTDLAGVTNGFRFIVSSI